MNSDQSISDLKVMVIRSGFWSICGNWVSKIIGIAKMVILARLLSPVDFGLMGLAVVCIGLIKVLSEIGHEAALIQKSDIGDSEIHTAWTISIIRGVFLFGILFVSADWISEYYKDQNLKNILRVVSIIFVIEGFTNIDIVLHKKKVDFGPVAKIELLSDFLSAAIVILLAVWMQNVWVLVVGNVTGSAFKCIGSYLVLDYRPKLFWNKSAAKDLFHFGKHIYWISLATFIITSGDDALIGKMLGFSLLGFYAMAYNIANLPVTSLTQMVSKVTFSAYSILQMNTERMAAAFQDVMEVTLIIIFPVILSIILMGDLFVEIVFSERWLPMVPVLKWLCVMGLLRSIAQIMGPINLAINRPESESFIKMLEFITFVVLIYPAIKYYGLVGAGTVAVLAYTISVFGHSISISIKIPFFYKRLLRATIVPFATSGAFFSGVLIGKKFIQMQSKILNLAIPLAFGSLFFAILTLILKKKLIKELISNMSFLGKES